MSFEYDFGFDSAQYEGFDAAYDGAFDIGSDASASGPDSFFSDWDFSSILSNVGDAFRLALQVNQAYQSAQQPPVRTSNATTTANSNGMLTTRTSTGGVVQTRMPVGTGYLTTDGVMVVNNGNGTFSVTNPDGSTTTRPYQPSSSGAGGSSNLIPLLLLGGGALYLLSRAK